MIEGVLAGDELAARRLFDRHWPAAWRTAYGITGRRAAADDAAQDGIAQAFLRLAQFDGERPFGAWLHRIVANRALDLVRRERRGAPLSEEGVADPVDWVGRTHDHDELMAALAGLPRDRRLVVVLRHWAGWTPAEIADALQVPVGTVYSRLGRALDQLRTRVEVGRGDGS